MFQLFKLSKGMTAWVGFWIMMVFLLSWYQIRLGEIKVRDAQRKSDIELVGRALRVYFADYGTYPDGDDAGRIVLCGDLRNIGCEWGNSKLIDEDGVVYLSQMPRDPFVESKGFRYFYDVDELKQSFRIYTALENTRDSEIKKDLTFECGNGVKCMWYVE